MPTTKPVTTNADLLQEARKLDAEATPGPWRQHDSPSLRWVIVGDAETSVALCGNVAGEQGIGDYRIALTNAAFIARSRTLLPQLADALERERAEFAATLRVVRQGLDPADPTYKIATEAIDRLETPDCPARPEPGT